MTLATLEHPKLWTPGDPPLPPIRHPNGDIEIYRPLDLEFEKRRLREEVRQEAEDLEFLQRTGCWPMRGAAAGAWLFTNGGRTSLLDGTFDLDTDTFKVALFLSTSDLGAASTTFAGVSDEHAGANGYTAGGVAATIALSGTTTVKVDETSNPVWTASGGPITARFGALYEVSGNILCYFLLDSAPADVTASDGNTLTITIHANGVFTLA